MSGGHKALNYRDDQLNMQPMYHYRDTKTIPIKIVLASLLSTLTQGGKFYSSAI